MCNVFAPVFASHLRSSMATNSGPLSDRKCSGTPFSTMMSAGAEMTLDEDQRRSARTIRHSRVSADLEAKERRMLPHQPPYPFGLSKKKHSRDSRSRELAA